MAQKDEGLREENKAGWTDKNTMSEKPKVTNI